MRLIIAGSRSITDYAALRWCMIDSGLWKAHKQALVVISGGARGVDALGVDFALKNGLQYESVPADWDDIKAPGAVVKTRGDGVMYNAKAGHDRNQRMADTAQALCLLWDGQSTGSWDMLKRARQKGLLIHEYQLRPGRGTQPSRTR